MADFKTLALGVGNTLMTDEAVGPRAVLAFEQACGDLPGLTCVDAGTLSFTLAETIGDADALIVFDAARLGGEPGTVRTLEGAEMDAFIRSGKLTPHEVGLTDLLDMARITGDLPRRRALIAVQPESIDWGLELTETVAKALPEAVAQARAVMAFWAQEQGVMA